jgi:hypothetical protein
MKLRFGISTVLAALALAAPLATSVALQGSAWVDDATPAQTTISPAAALPSGLAARAQALQAPQAHQAHEAHEAPQANFTPSSPDA